MQNVIISVGTDVEVEAPYDPHFHDAADEIGGTIAPDGDVWRFARSDEDRIRRLCSEIYGNSRKHIPYPARRTAPATHHMWSR